MIAAITAAWTWFTGTKLGRWLIELAAILAAAGAAYFYVYTRGKHAQAKTDAAKDASVQADAVKVAAQTYTDASQAAAKVVEQAKAEPAPDPVKREDFDNEF